MPAASSAEDAAEHGWRRAATAQKPCGGLIRLHPKHTQSPQPLHHRQGTPAEISGTYAIHSTETIRPLGIAKAAGGQGGDPGGSLGVNQSEEEHGAKRDAQKDRKSKCLTGAVGGTSCCAGVRLRACGKFPPPNCAYTAHAYVVSEILWRTQRASACCDLC